MKKVTVNLYSFNELSEKVQEKLIDENREHETEHCDWYSPIVEGFEEGLKNPTAFQEVINVFYEKLKNEKIDKVIGIESRGFIFGAPLAYKLNVGFVPIRKKGKLPGETISVNYDLEYGTDPIEMHTDALQ